MTDFVFLLDRPSGAVADTGLTWAVEGAGTNPANATDFVGGVFPSGTGGFAQGVTRWAITVPVNPDLTVETDETFDLVVKKNGVEVARVRGTIINDDTSGEAPYVVYGNVADLTPVLTRTSRPMVARAGIYRDDANAGDQHIEFRVLMIDTNNYVRHRVLVSGDGGIAKVLSAAIVNGTETFNGFNNRDIPVDISNCDISFEFLANKTAQLVQTATSLSKKLSDGTAVAAGTRKVLDTYSTTVVTQLMQQATDRTGDANSAQIVRVVTTDFGGNGKPMKNVGIGTPA